VLGEWATLNKRRASSSLQYIHNLFTILGIKYSTSQA
jgi:hypothetical protein